MRHLYTVGPCDHATVRQWFIDHFRLLRDFEHEGRRNGNRHSHFVFQTPSDHLGTNFAKRFRTVYPIGDYKSKLIKDTAEDLTNVLFYLEKDDCETCETNEETDPPVEENSEGNDSFATDFWLLHQDKLTELARSLRGKSERETSTALHRAILYMGSAGKKTTVGDLHSFCASNNITDRGSFDRHPESARFLGLFGLNGHLTNIFGMVTAAGVKSYISPATLPTAIEEALMTYPDASKIYKYLHDVQGWTPEQVFLFGNLCFDVANRRCGKKNTMWISGVSNAGKSRVMDAFITGYFNGNVGLPDNTPKTSFKWGGCVNKRVILWDEPFAMQEESEVLKLILGGEPANVQVKYQTSTFINPTPVFVTSNKKLHEILRIEWQAAKGVFDNRMFHFRMQVACPPDQVDSYFPMAKEDWDQFGFLCSMWRTTPATKKARIE